MIFAKTMPILLFIIMLLSLHSCSDFKETGIEGKWQLVEKRNAEGKTSSVDTVFYSFDKNVFQYLKLQTNTTNFYCFGNYSRSGNEISIEVDKNSFQPDIYKFEDCDNCLDWSELNRKFIVIKENSKVLELESEGEVLRFRKY